MVPLVADFTSMPPLIGPPTGVDPSKWLAACAAIRSYCRWHIAPSVSEVLTLDGSGRPVQFLPTLRLTELSLITNDGVTITNPEWSRAGMVRGPRCWSSKWRAVVASITHGYDECPAEIVPILTDMAQAISAGGGTSVQAGPFSVRGGQNDAQTQAGIVGLSDEQKRVLAPYRLELVP